MPTSSRQPTTLFAKSAVTLGLIVLGGYLVVAVTLTRDFQERPQVEELVSVTGVGDLPVYPLAPDAPLPKEELLKLEGMALYARKARDRRDWQMRRSGKDDGGIYPLYRRYHQRSGAWSEEVYLKLAPGRYLELTPRQPKVEPTETTAPEPSPVATSP